MSYKPKILTVPEGGLGVNAHTAFVPLFGGTTSTAAVQDLAAIGSATNALTSNGPGVLPTAQPLSAGSLGYLLKVGAISANPANATSYFFGVYNASFIGVTTGTIGSAVARIYIPIAGTINSVYGSFTSSPSSAESCTLAIRKNNTTDTVISSSLSLAAGLLNFNSTTVGLSLVAGDFISVKFTSPTWVTPPTGVTFTLSMLLN